MDHSRSEIDSPKKPFSSKLSEFRPFNCSATCGWQQWENTVHIVPSGLLHKTDASHGVFVLERAIETAKEWKTPLFLALLRKHHNKRKGYQSSCSRYSANGGPRGTLQSAWRGSPVTNASPPSGVSHKEPQSRQQSLWLFLIMSWGTWMLGGETETLGGQWTTSTSRAPLTLTTSVCWRQAHKTLSLWSKNALMASWLQAWKRAWTQPSGPARHEHQTPL